MPGMLYQVVNRQRALLEKQRRAPAAQPVAKPVLRITVKPKEGVAPTPVASGEEPAKALPTHQTVGLHNVPRELVEALKVEAQRRSSKGKKMTLTDVALHCLRVGLLELQSADEKQL